jgi:hypothetical protein
MSVVRRTVCLMAVLLVAGSPGLAQRRADATTGYGMYGGVTFYDSDVGPALRIGVLYEGAPQDFPFRLRGEFEYQRILDDPGANVIAIIGSGLFYFPRSSGRGKTNIYGIAGFGPYIISGGGRRDTETEFGFHLGAGYQSRRGAYRPFYEGRLTFVDEVVGLGGAIGFRF